MATYNFVVTGELVEIAQWNAIDDMLGPTYNVFCGLSSQCLACSYWWTVSNKIVAGNGALIEAEASRFSLQQGTNFYIFPVSFYGDSLQIRNALKTDAIMYECHVTLNGQTVGSATLNKPVPASFYLPSSMYPKCHVSPSMTLLERSNITFRCTPGESQPPVNLTLSLQRQDGSEIDLRTETTTKQVTIDDNNAMFICHMTSETFPTAYGNCTAGPLTVIQATTTTEATSIPLTSSTLVNIDTSSQTSGVLYGIIGGSVGAALVVLMIVILCVKRFKSKESNSSETTFNDGGHDGRAPNQDHLSNTTYAEETLDQIPMYSVVNDRARDNPSDAQQMGETSYGHTNIINPREASNSPLYSKVNSSYKTEEDKEGTRDSWTCGMIANTIYVSAGPK